MADLISNHLKAVLFMDDITSDRGRNVFRQDCLTIRHYGYNVARSRDELGIATSLSTKSSLGISIRLHSVAAGKQFYEAMWREKPQSFSVLFNVKFGADGKVSDYDDAIVINGYVTDIDTAFENEHQKAGEEEQMNLTLGILICDIVYVGKTDNSTLVVRR